MRRPEAHLSMSRARSDFSKRSVGLGDGRGLGDAADGCEILLGTTVQKPENDMIPCKYQHTMASTGFNHGVLGGAK